MGLDVNAVRFLIAARKAGASFEDVLMIGRQDLNVYPGKMVLELQRHGFSADVFAKGGEDTKFAEPVFAALGARRVASLDVSGFEGASYVHDLNQPVPPEWHARFDVVYDGGTLEHIFHFPVALRNCMEMVKPGGRLMIHTIANNWCGHGFYQFSPELFFRALSAENGFKMERAAVHRVGPYGSWYEVADPESIRSRVEVVTFTPLQLWIQAQRTEVVPVFARPPQQSDYTPRWTDRNDAKDGRKDEVDYSPTRSRLARFLPGLARLGHVLRMGIALYRNQTLANRRCFRPLPKP
jgi:hypothetical protein